MPTLPRQDLDHVLEHVGEHWTALEGSHVFITGGTGFVGKWLLETLLWANGERNLRVRVGLLRATPAGSNARLLIWLTIRPLACTRAMSERSPSRTENSRT